jgi:hypothetical protein
VNCGPWSILLHLYYFLLQAPFTFRNYYLLTTNKYHLPHDMFNPLLLANRWDWQPHRKLGQCSLVVLCAGSMLLLAQTPRHHRLFLALLPKSASNNLRKWFLSPTGRLNLGIITKGKLIVVLIIPSFWGFPTGPVRHHGSHRLICIKPNLSYIFPSQKLSFKILYF